MFLSRFSIKNPVLITMAVIALIIFGVFAVKSLGIELLPAIDAPYVTVTAIYPGADAKTIEEEVVKKIEDEIGVLSGIDKMNSTVVDNVGFILIVFKDNVKTETAVQDVRDKIARVKSSLPEDVEDPVVEKFDINATAFLSIIVKAPAGENPLVVTEIAKKKIKGRISAISGVGKVEMYGGKEREIKILMDPLKLNSYKIPALSLIQAIEASSVKIPAGSIKMKNGAQEISVKGDAEITDVSKFIEMLLIKNESGGSLKIKDFARVIDGFEEEESASFMDLTPAIGLDVKKQGKVNVVALAKEVRAEIETIRKDLPEGYIIEIIGDTTSFTGASVYGSIVDVVIGALLAVSIILLFLRNRKAALIVAVSLPASIIGTFLFVKIMGFSLNIMTTLALSLCVGILSDDAIVIIDAIFRHLKAGKNKIQAAMDATKEVGLAVISSELALISVFGPAVMMEGLVGKLFGEFGITVIISILISVVVSFTVTPLFASYILKEESSQFFVFRFMEKILLKTENIYVKAVTLVLKHKFKTIFTAATIFFLGLLLVGSLKSQFIPDIDMGLFTMKVELPAETSIEKSKEIIREIIEQLSLYEWEKNAYSSIGAGATKEKNLITIKITMKDRKERNVTAVEAVDQLREKFDYMKAKYGAKIYFIPRDETLSMGAVIQLDLLGNNFESLDKASRIVMDYMENEGGFKDVMSDNKGYKKELRIKFDHTKMTDLGVNSAESAITLRYLISGKRIAKIGSETGETDEIKIYLDDPYKSLEGLRNIPLRSGTAQGVRLSDVADISYDSGIVQINRFNKTRNIKISADVASGYDLGTQMSKLKKFASENLPADVSFEEGGMAEMMSDSFKYLIMALIIAVFLIYIVLSSQFNSFIHPFTIMSALPFAMTGAILTLYFTGMALSIFSFIGVFLLMGIVTKNSILLIDFTIQLMNEGMDMTSAILKSSRTRLRPIIMTASSTIIGMVPVVISTSEGAEMKHAMGWAVMGGLIFSTFVTLFIVPVIFSYFNVFTAKRNIERENEISAL